MSVPEPVAEYLGEVTGRLRAALGHALTGVYLHGSAAMGGWHPARSDVDVLIVVSRALSDAEKSATGRLLAGVPCPGSELECSVVCASTLAIVSERPPFELHVCTGATAKTVDGTGHPGDSDLVMHYAVCRARGIAFAGPPPADVFPEVPRQMLVRAFAEELLWGLEHAPAHYAVLNACRAWAYAEDGQILSKVEGGDWALQRGFEREAVEQALALQSGDGGTIQGNASERLVSGAREALLHACGRES